MQQYSAHTFHVAGAGYENAHMPKFLCIVGNVSKGRAEDQVVLTAVRLTRCLFR